MENNRIVTKTPDAYPRRAFYLCGAGYGSRTRLNGLGSRCNTDIPTLHIIRDLWRRKKYFIISFRKCPYIFEENRNRVPVFYIPRMRRLACSDLQSEITGGRK